MHEAGGGVDPSSQRGPRRDLLDPRGPMGMPKIVSRLADRARRGRPGSGSGSGSGSVATLLFALSVLAIMIAFGLFFIVGGH